MKKSKILIALLLVLNVLLNVACFRNTDSKGNDEVQGNVDRNGKDLINIYTRDNASGTRAGFEEVVGFKGELSDVANEVSSNGEMANQVGTDPQAIGYVSLTTDFAANNLRPLSYESVVASLETVNQGSYNLSRPFSYCTRAEGDFDSADKEALVKAFIAFITESKEGMEIILAAGGIVDISEGKPWSEIKLNHPIVDNDNSEIEIVTAGSTSVRKSISMALEAFQALAGNVQFRLNQSGSSDGWKRVLGGEKDGPNKADIGFASRDFKPEEDLSSAALKGVYCQDAIVVVVNAERNNLDNLTREDVLKIFTGQITDWSEIK